MAPKTAELATRIRNTEKAVKRLVADEQAHLRHSQDSSGDPEEQFVEDHRPDAGSDDEDDTDDEGHGVSSEDDTSVDRDEQFLVLEEEVAELVADVHDLALFSKLNFTGFMKILKVCRLRNDIPSLWC